MAYTLKNFITDLERITGRETEPQRVIAQVAPLLSRLSKVPDAIPSLFRRRPPDGRRGRYMLHRGAAFNVTSVVWAPGEALDAHNHDTWGVIGVVENEILETRYRVPPGCRPEPYAVLRHRAGAISSLLPPDNDVHAMHNPTDRDTVEIHVYGRDLVGLKRQIWAADGTGKPLISPKYLNC